MNNPFFVIGNYNASIKQCANIKQSAMKNLLTFIFLIVSVLSFGQTTDKIFTIKELLSNPKSCNGKVVTVTGYYIDEFENRSLSPSKKGTKKFNGKSSLWLESFAKDIKYFDKKETETSQSFLYNKSVIVTGLFKCEPDTISGKVYGYGHMNIFPAQLTEITFMKEN